MKDQANVAMQKLGFTREQGAARNSFKKLCAAGCEARVLAELFGQWKLLRGALLINGREIHLNPMDDWDAALKGFKPKDLADLGPSIQRHQGDLRELWATLASLHRTRLVQRLAETAGGNEVHQTAIVVGEATSAVLEVLELYRTSIMPVILEASHKIGRRRSPDRNRRQRTLCEYVHDETQRYFYEDIALIFQALDPATPVTAESLKQREHRAKKVTESSRK